jgi:hypothetical protein
MNLFKAIQVWSAKVRRQWTLLKFRVTGRHPFPYFRKIKVPTYKIEKNPEIRISEIKTRRFYIVDRAQIRAKSLMNWTVSPDGDSRYQARPISTNSSYEDAELFRTLDALSHSV